MLMRQATLANLRKAKKNAAKTIEKYWIAYKERQRLREIRKYLFTLPYECRLLYIKFKQVKHDADKLKTDVDLMIAKKQGQTK